MDLDMITNGSTIKNSITSLNNGKISWVVLGYSTNKTLNVIETGNDSFEDMFEELDSNKIMYGFATVIDPNTKLKKNVFIHWQGEGASQSMKTTSVQHVNIIRDICKPVHVTHVARSEQDLDLKEIMTKVANASGSNYSCHSETKQMFQKQPSVKSEDNTASNVRQSRMEELKALENLQKESIPNLKIGTNYEKVNAVNEIKNLRPKKIEESRPYKPVGANYTKIDAAKEIKSSTANPTREHVPFKSLGTLYDRVDASKEIKSFKSNAPVKENVGSNYTKIDAAKEIKLSTANSASEHVPFKSLGTSYDRVDASKEIKSFKSNAPVNENVGSSYKRINPAQEFKSLNVNQKATFENKITVQSENNTAQRAKEERQKELSNLFSKKSNCEDLDQKVGTNYTRTNPVAEINKLRRVSITNEEDDVFSRPTGNYKKIDPNAEMKNLRRSSSSETSDPVSPTTYKKINPAEEIKRLRSQSTFTDIRLNNTGYKKIDPLEEIVSARKMSETAEIEMAPSKSSTKTVSEVKQKVTLSARKSFENVHKKDEVHHPQKMPIKKQVSTEVHEPVPPTVTNTPREDLSKTAHVPVQTKTEMTREAPAIPGAVVTSTVTPLVIKKTAEAQFSYQATDVDEISFHEGELIHDIEMIDDDWWTGVNAAGDKGMFPSNYVLPIEGVEQPKEIRPIIVPEQKLEHNDTKNTLANTKIEHTQPPQLETHVVVNAVAVYDYQANDGDEISFDIGEMLTEIEQIDDGWWIGCNSRGEKGMFPSNFVEIQNSEEEVCVQPAMSPKSDPETHRSVTVHAIFDYCAQDDDEMSFNIGDVIYNVTEVDDGWWEGEIAGGRRGLFPSNYVEAV